MHFCSLATDGQSELPDAMTDNWRMSEINADVGYASLVQFEKRPAQRW